MASSAAIQAVCAVFVGIFTWRLVVSNKGLLKAAQDNASAANNNAEAASNAAAIAEANLKAFMATNKQWLDTDDWGLIVRPLPDKPQFYAATLNFSIINNTPLVVTLRTVRSHILNWSKTYLQAPLGPKNPSRVETTFLIFGENAISYEGDGCQLAIAGWIDYVDAMGQTQHQPFGMLFRMRINYKVEFRQFDFYLEKRLRDLNQPYADEDTEAG